MSSKQQRVATVKARGEKFVVLALDFSADKASCLGEVYGYKARGAHVVLGHDDTTAKRFKLDDVTIQNVTITVALAEQLMEQAKKNPEIQRKLADYKAGVAQLNAAMADVAAVRKALKF